VCGGSYLFPGMRINNERAHGIRAKIYTYTVIGIHFFSFMP
jgi:hypothetical protein